MFSIKKSTIFLLVAVILFTAALSGCRTKEPVERKDDYSGVELTYHKVFDDSEVMQPLIDELVTGYPGLKINYRKFADFQEYEKTILNEMAEGEGPDIFSMQNTWFMSNYRKLTPMPQELGGVPSNFEKTFVSVAYDDLVRTNPEGVMSIYGVPMTVDTLALYFNKDHFEDRLAAQGGRPSLTWEGIKEDVQLLVKEDESFDRFEVAGIAMGRADNISRGVDILYMLFSQYGVKFYNDNISEATFTGKVAGVFDYPALDALDFYTSFADEDQKHFTWNEYVVDDDSEEKELEAFARGDVSMIFGYAYGYDQILDYIKINEANGYNSIDKDSVRVAPAPQVYDPEVSSEKRVAYASYFAETVSRNCEHPEIAWDFLIFLTKKDQLDYYFEKTGKPTSRRDMIEDQMADPVYGVFAEQTAFGESFPIVDYYLYKDLFADVINEVNEEGSSKGKLVDAQNVISGMLPEEGYVIPEVKVEENAENEQ